MSDTPPKTVAIVLEGNTYDIRTPLTLGQCDDCAIAVMLPDSDDPQESLRRGIKRSLDVLSIGLSADHPEMTVDKLKAMRISRDERNAAIEQIFSLAGLRMKEAKPGEAGPEAPTGAA